jgi:ABC-type phosphate transport system substrate-binding protein
VRARPPQAWWSGGVRSFVGLSLAMVIAAAAATGCGAGPIAGAASGHALGQATGETSTTLSPLMEAYFQAHPGFVDGSLTPAPATADKILADIHAGLDPGRDIWLPEYLPDGFELAAPYNGDGSGSAYPNPHAWGRGYSITYTDGAGYIMVMANSDDDLTQGEWTALAETVAGRHLRLQQGPGIALVATVDDGGTPLLVSGGGLPGSRLTTELIRVAESLARR